MTTICECVKCSVSLSRGHCCATCDGLFCEMCIQEHWISEEKGRVSECVDCRYAREKQERSSDPSQCAICKEALPYGSVGCNICRIACCHFCTRIANNADGETFSVKCANCAPEIAPHGERRAVCPKCSKRSLDFCEECNAEYCMNCHEDGLMADLFCNPCAKTWRNNFVDGRTGQFLPNSFVQRDKTQPLEFDMTLPDHSTDANPAIGQPIMPSKPFE